LAVATPLVLGAASADAVPFATEALGVALLTTVPEGEGGAVAVAVARTGERLGVRLVKLVGDTDEPPLAEAREEGVMVGL
jgi:hypothetical protein